MSKLNDAKYISDASKTVYHTYLQGEPMETQASILLTLVINTIEASGQKERMMAMMFNALGKYHNTENVMDLANGNLN